MMTCLFVYLLFTKRDIVTTTSDQTPNEDHIIQIGWSLLCGNWTEVINCTIVTWMFIDDIRRWCIQRVERTRRRKHLNSLPEEIAVTIVLKWTYGHVARTLSRSTRVIKCNPNDKNQSKLGQWQRDIINDKGDKEMRSPVDSSTK